MQFNNHDSHINYVMHGQVQSEDVARKPCPQLKCLHNYYFKAIIIIQEMYLHVTLTPVGELHVEE